MRILEGRRRADRSRMRRSAKPPRLRGTSPRALPAAPSRPASPGAGSGPR
jgi:hypothetical protein